MRIIAIPTIAGSLSCSFDLNPVKSYTIDFCIFHVKKNGVITDVRVVDASINLESFEKWCIKNKVTDLITYKVGMDVIKILNRNKINVFPGVTPSPPQRLVRELIDGTLITNSKVIEIKQ